MTLRMPDAAAPGAAVEVAPLRDSECAAAAALLARAFRDNPLNVAVVGAGSAAERLRSNVLGMTALLPVALERGEVWAARLGGVLAGALIGSPAWCYPLPPPQLRARLRCLVGQGWRVSRRWAHVFEALDALHPPQPHRYLGTLGVAPEQQRRGVGSALLGHWAGRADEEELPVYLETDRRENLAFYAREGFDVVGETRVLDTPVWQMQRRPRRLAPG